MDAPYFRGKFDEIIRRFPTSGHTMLPCDHDFADIESSLQNSAYLHTRRIHGRCAQSKEAQPVWSAWNDIKDCSSLSKCFTMGKTKCWWRENNVQKCDSDEISRKPIKHDAKWNIPTMKRKHGKMYTWTREDEIGTWKWQAEDVKSLMCYVPACHHEFYNSLRADENKTANSDIIDWCGWEW